MDISPTERVAIQTFVDSPFIYGYITNLFEKRIAKTKEQIFNKSEIATIANEEIGAELRACVRAQQIIQSVFGELNSFKSMPMSSTYKNPAR